VLVLEVVEDGHVVFLEDRHVVVEILALERVGDDRLVLDADLIAEPLARERADRAFELPRRRVRAGKREMPGDVVLEDRRRAARQRARDARDVEQAIDVGEDGIGLNPEDRDLRLHFPLATCVLRTTDSPAYCWTIDRTPV